MSDYKDTKSADRRYYMLTKLVNKRTKLLRKIGVTPDQRDRLDKLKSKLEEEKSVRSNDVKLLELIEEVEEIETACEAQGAVLEDSPGGTTWSGS
jgi:hypothetical protein